MAGLSLLPTITSDILGSSANILLAFLALNYARLLTKRQPGNFVWGYLYYVTFAIFLFSISRGMGHLVKQFLLIGGQAPVWRSIAPYSGGFNTLFMISVAAVMIFYHKGVQAYEALEREADKLKNAYRRLAVAAGELRDLNQNLEQKVEARSEELSRSEKKFRHLFLATKDMVFFTDARGRVVEINGSGLEMLGYSREEAGVLGLDELFVLKEERESFGGQLVRDGFIKDLHLEFRKKDRSHLSVLLSATALVDESGTLLGAEAIAKDLTRVKTMLEQLSASEKMASVGQMAAGVAHEINTPLGIILGYSQLMMDDFDPKSEHYQNLQVVERQTKATRKIVADLLKFSRQSGSTWEDVDLNEVLGDVVAVTEHTLGLSHVHICLDLEGDLPKIVGDPEKLRQVFVNLLNNAHHAMEESGGGQIFLRTSFLAAEGRVKIEVRDTGKGIPEKNLSKIFDPFFTTKPVGQGTGLGLSVSYGIVQDHGGAIAVESPVIDAADHSPSPGTLFSISLPVSQNTGG
jgi:two-component system, NtrC family, sensor kinase